MGMRTVSVVTGTRAEYGLLKSVMREIERREAMQLHTIVTGAHLDPRHGETWREIAGDGFAIDARVPILDGDSFEAVAGSVGRAVQGIASALAGAGPDACVVLGDRYEAFAAVTAAYLLRIPVAHIGGGELTEGALDDGLRHAMTKLSHWHFASAGEYRRRILQLGEEPERVHDVGALGADSVRTTDYLTREALAVSLEVTLGDPFVVVTFHPVTLDEDGGVREVEELLAALEQTGVYALFTMPNADPCTDAVASRIIEFVESRPDHAAAFASLGQQRYLSAVAHAAAVVGNSSSGIIEAPILGVPTVNIGERQDGRLRAASIIDCPGEAVAIAGALARALSPVFREAARLVVSPYGDGHAAERIVAILADHFEQGADLHKRFFDLPHVEEA